MASSLKVCKRLPEAGSQITSVLPDFDASRLPSAEKKTKNAPSQSGATNVWVQQPRVVSQILTVESRPKDASREPSGEKSTEKT